MIRALRAAWGRDLAREIRGGGLWETLLFVFTAVLLYTFTLPADRAVLAAAAPGIFWSSLLFATLLLTTRRIAESLRGGLLEILLGNGMPPLRLFLSEAFSLFISVTLLGLLLLLPLILFTGIAPEWGLLPIFLLGTFGLAVSGTGLGLLTRSSRRREILFPFLYLLMVLPILLPAAAASAAGIEREDALLLLAGFDIAQLSLLSLLAPDLLLE